MGKVLSTSDKLNPRETWQRYNLECEKLKSELESNGKDLRFLQDLLDRYFDEIVQNENLDEVRESLMRFQDLCYNCGHLKKRVKDQQRLLVDIINDSSEYDPNTVHKEQAWIEKCKSSLMKDCKIVKKEMLNIVNKVIHISKDNQGLVFQS